jgi:hypothetical protein
MLLSGSLASLASAWITPGVDDPAIKTLLSGFYPKVKGAMMDQLVSISRRKAVFPYAALSQRELLDEKVISKEHFFDELYGKAISDEDYNTYLETNKQLEEILTGELRNHTASMLITIFTCV